MTTTKSAKHEVPQLSLLIRTLLGKQGCFDHAAERVRLIETHISWVLLTGDYAYKIKKPLDLGFLDFSSLELRKQACADEVRLNRRLAADIYLGVVAITGSPDVPHINGTGAVIEYAVKMRQFPPDATLDRLSARGELGAVQIDRLAERLSQFHLEVCQKAPADSVWGEPETIARPAIENFQMLAGCLKDPQQRICLDTLQGWSVAEHARLTPLLHERKRKGMIRECHGDLHLGNLAWVEGKLLIFDCIEFSAALRWIDVISEVAFCFMDLLHRDHRDLAMRFLNAWLETSGDYAGVALLRYYSVYRALVRAKVAALRAGQPGDSAASRAELNSCLLLAEQLAQSMPTQLWITHGLSGCGKTTLSQKLLQDYGMIRLRSDVERKRLAGLDALAHSGAGVGQGLYTKEASRRTYEHLSRLADELLSTGWPVIVDAAFLEHWQRDMFRAIARRRGVPVKIVDIQTDIAILRERVNQRAAQSGDASEADLHVLQYQIETAQPLGDEELGEVMAISASAGTKGIL